MAQNIPATVLLGSLNAGDVFSSQGYVGTISGSATTPSKAQIVFQYKAVFTNSSSSKSYTEGVQERPPVYLLVRLFMSPGSSRDGTSPANKFIAFLGNSF